MTQYELTQEELSDKVGKNRATIANRIRLLQLPWELQTALADGRLTEGQVRPLLALKSKTTCDKLNKLLLTKGLSARQVEDMVRNQKQRSRLGAGTPVAGNSDANIISLEESLQEALGLRVKSDTAHQTIKANLS